MNDNLPIDLLHWLLALSPLALLLILLVWARWSAPEAGPVGLALAVLIAMLVFRAPLGTVASASAKGLWDAIFILYVIWPALLLYQVTKQAGAFQAMRLGIQEHSRNRLFLVLAFGWVFATFLQGIAGFGAPIAIVAPLLVGLGVTPVMAVVIPLVGHSWANMFGTLAVSWHATNLVVDLQNAPLTAWLTAWMLWIPNFLAGITIAWLFAGWRGVKAASWAVLIITLIHGGGQLLLTQVNPTLSNFIPATLALAMVFVLARWSRYRERTFDESPVMQESEAADQVDEEPKMTLWEAFLPYIVLTVVTVTALVIPAISRLLEQWEVGFPFPGTTTGYGVEREAEDPYSPFAVLTHPGTFLLMACVVGYLWFKHRDEYGERPIRAILGGTIGNAVPASVAVLAFLATSKVMDDSGQVTVLARGIAEVSPPVIYAAAANFIGILGAFMTSSNTASNVLFAPLHSQTAQAVPALNQAQVIASQSAGGAIGNAIAPANVVLGTGTAGITGQEGEVLKYTLVYALIAGVLVGILGVVFYLMLGS